jgi:uncharacterized protein (TIGR02466 family)
MLDLWFPTQIYREKLEDFEQINSELRPVVKAVSLDTPCGGSAWIGRPYNTCGTWNIATDERFKIITDKVTRAANMYCSLLGVDTGKHPVKCEEGWLNIYEHSDFQEYHAHDGFKISAVYYLDTTENSSIYFQSPYHDVNPLPIRLHSAITDQRADYRVEEGQIIVFRSYLRHCVPPLKDNGTRISLAFNFN